ERLSSFISCYANHLYLHSFPTRRSSDLNGNELAMLARTHLVDDLGKRFFPATALTGYKHRHIGRSHLHRYLNSMVQARRITNNRSEEHTSELQSRENLVCRLLLEKKNIK